VHPRTVGGLSGNLEGEQRQDKDLRRPTVSRSSTGENFAGAWFQRIVGSGLVNADSLAKSGRPEARSPYGKRKLSPTISPRRKNTKPYRRRNHPTRSRAHLSWRLPPLLQRPFAESFVRAGLRYPVTIRHPGAAQNDEVWRLAWAASSARDFSIRRFG